jgi:outer membrane lipoprotein-sorting protein
MKNAFRYVLIFFAFANVFGFVHRAQAQGVLTDLLERMDTYNKQLKSVKAAVTMVKFNSQLGVPDTYEGRTTYLTKIKGKRYMRLDWEKPAVEQISVIGDEYELYKPRINVLYFGRVDKSKNSAVAGNALTFMSMSRAELKANYSVVFPGDEVVSANVKTAHLQLTPKGTAGYKSAELWVNANGMPVQGKIVEMNNDTTTVTLTNIQTNISMDGGVFKLKHARNVKRQPL